MMIPQSSCIFLLLIGFLSCRSDPSSAPADGLPTSAAPEIMGVKTNRLIRKNFTVSILTNGLVRFTTQSRLGFKIGGTLAAVEVANGSAVAAGQLLARLDNRDQQLAFQQAADQFNDARLELNSLVLQNDGRDGDTSSVKPRVLEFLKYKSGYNRALTALQLARRQLELTFLRAPYAGIIANMTGKPYNLLTPDQPFCTLLGREGMYCEFSVLESELPAVRRGRPVRITPLALPEQAYSGSVTEINPFVSSQGLVQIRARINRPDGSLFEGMNVRVRIESRLRDQLVVARESVVDRSGRKVIFTHEQGRAKWNDVRLGYENEREVTVAEGLQPGDEVIFSGNLNLAHDAPVKTIR